MLKTRLFFCADVLRHYHTSLFYGLPVNVIVISLNAFYNVEQGNKKPELRYFEVPVRDCGAGDYSRV